MNNLALLEMIDKQPLLERDKKKKWAINRKTQPY